MRTRFVLLAAAVLASASGLLFVAPPAAPVASKAKPVVLALSTHQASSAGGTKLTITGKHFTAVKSVHVGNAKATFARISSTKLTITAPKHAAGTAYLTVTTTTGTSAKAKATKLTYVAPKANKKPAPPQPTATPTAMPTPTPSQSSSAPAPTGTPTPIPTSTTTPSAPAPDFATWAAARLPLPDDADTSPQNVGISQVSCASASLCALVGGYMGGNTQQQLLSVYSHGTWSSINAMPPGATGIGLNSVSCVADGCVAVGDYYVQAAHAWRGLIDTWSNGTWTAQAAPHPPGEPNPDPETDLFSVSCWTEGACVAVGAYTVASSPSTREAAVIETLDNGTWTAQIAPLPLDADPYSGDQYSELQHVACAASNSCVAGGYYIASTDEQPLLEHFDGGDWTPVQAPLPTAGGQVLMKGASCATSNSSCVVIAQYYDGSSHEQGLLERWDGTSWAAAEAPLPADAGANPWVILDGISCAPSAGCVAAGYYSDTTNVEHALTEQWATNSWSATAPDLPADADAAHPYSFLNGLSCVASGCAAAGYYVYLPDDADASMIEALPSDVWIPHTAALPGDAYAGADNQLAAISCGSDGFCLAAGYYKVADHMFEGVVLTTQ